MRAFADRRRAGSQLGNGHRFLASGTFDFFAGQLVLDFQFLATLGTAK
jgi:hypothetical protein